MLHARGIEGTRVLQGLCQLTKKHPCDALEKACEIALSHGVIGSAHVRQLLETPGRHSRSRCRSCDEHPIIRPLDDYAQIVRGRSIAKRIARSVGEGFGRHGWTKVRLCRALQQK